MTISFLSSRGMHQNKRVTGLDFLRAIAIVWVMMFHALGAGLGTPAFWISYFGWMGVDLFFVLSGYLIGWQLLKQISQGHIPHLQEFYIRRAFRILPAYSRRKKGGPFTWLPNTR